MGIWGKFGLGALVSLVFAGCSAEQTYNALQVNARNDCAKTATQVDYAECVERQNVSYEEYEAMRREGDKDDP